MTVGFRIKKTWERIAPDMVENFKSLPVANVGDCMSRMFAGSNALRPMHKDGVLAGPAFTVLTRPGDNLMLHKAIDTAAPGDVIVVDGGGDYQLAVRADAAGVAWSGRCASSKCPTSALCCESSTCVPSCTDVSDRFAASSAARMRLTMSAFFVRSSTNHLSST